MGPIFYLQLGSIPAIVVSSPETAKEVLKTLDAYCCNRPSSPGAIMLTYNYRDIAFSPYSESWRGRRKLFVSELVGSKRVESFAHALEAQVDQLIHKCSVKPWLFSPPFSAQDFFPASRVSLWFDKLIGLEARYKRIFRDLDAFFETVLRQHSDQERVLPEKDNLVDVLISIWKGQGCIYRRHSDRLSDIALGNV
ncbi:hypothetical protein HU200_041087 [Digitaria exilis]|uniref:Cytochrome P450 n=1 Tax=Digitaria exilis TaxID=1010633 RepID=A0A835EIC7_9POAL|nr:hypothetical protein HU200_041087 [Digitaria exilis]